MHLTNLLINKKIVQLEEDKLKDIMKLVPFYTVVYIHQLQNHKLQVGQLSREFAYKVVHQKFDSALGHTKDFRKMVFTDSCSVLSKRTV